MRRERTTTEVDGRPRRRRTLAPTRDARLLRRSRLVSHGRLRRALAGYLGLAAAVPGSLEARNRAGDLLARSGRLAQAIEMFESVAREHDDRGFEAKAAAIRRKILRLAPAHRGARRALAAWLRSAGRHRDALEVEGADPRS